jgi:hypothetical protein
MLTGMLAAHNVLGESHDLWDVNTERSYYEEFTTERVNSSSPLPDNVVLISPNSHHENDPDEYKIA